MTIPPSQPRPFHAAQGFAVFIVLVLLACLAVMLVANSTTLHVFKQELQQIDEKQKVKFEGRDGQQGRRGAREQR